MNFLRSFRPANRRGFVGILLALCCSLAHGQTENTLSGIMIFSGQNPTGGLITKKNLQGQDTVYGVSQLIPSGGDGYFIGRPMFAGGSAAPGIIYGLATDASVATTLHQLGSEYDSKLFKIYKGYWPTGSLLSIGNDFYGVALYRSVDERTTQTIGAGTVFRFGPSGMTQLHAFADPDPFTLETITSNSNPLFTNPDGMAPAGGVIQGNDGFLYGVTRLGGANGTGVIYKLALDGSQFQVLHSFAARLQDSDNVILVNNDNNPLSSEGIFPTTRLIIGSDGYLYGTTTLGGMNGTGTIFKISRSGSGFTTLLHFDVSPPIIIDIADPNYGKARINSGGSYPKSGLIQNPSTGYLYGTASDMGSSGFGTVFCITPDGTTCSSTPTAGLTQIHAFLPYDATTGAFDGGSPEGDLIISHDGFLVGTTPYGGQNLAGTIYKLALDGSSISLLGEFGADTYNQGYSPTLGVIEIQEGSDYAYYGATRAGGYFGAGTIFKYGAKVTRQQGTPVNDINNSSGGGSLNVWFVLALLLLALVPAARIAMTTRSR